MEAWKYLIELHKVCRFHSRERKGCVSNSELRRWCNNKSFIVNGIAVAHDDIIEKPIVSLVLFPKRRRTTIY